MLLKKISLTTSYIIALSILIIWSTFAFFTMHTLISSQEIYGKLINLSGKQRMFSQKIALQTHLIIEHQSDIKRLVFLLESMKNDYDFIKNNLTSTDLNDFYFKQNGLDEQVELFFRLVENFINKPNFDDSKNITEFSFELLEPLHDAVFMFEKENQDIVKNLKNRESYIYIGTILTLILEAIFIIFPMIRSHTSYIEKLEDEIIKRTKDIQIFAKIFENSKEGIIITDVRKTILNVNDAFVNITGFSKEETIGETPFILNSKKQNREFYKKMWKDIHSKGIWQGEIINKRKDGKNITEFLTIMKLYVKKTIYYVSIFTDISEKFLNQQMLEYLATHDSLTGLLNRNEILSKIDSSINQVEKNKNLLALIFIDLDDFKKINDTMGHVMGDKFLIDLSTKLSSILQKEDTLARLGGDEFIILLENLEKIGDESSIIEKLKDIFSKPIVIEGKEFDVSASIGVVFYPNDNSDDSSLQNLLRKVDLAMYKSKENGKNKVSYYNKELESKFQTKLLLEKDLKEALKNNKLELCLQAKKNFHTEKINSAEALLRWNNNGENISPSIFIPIAEESSLIKEIDEWVVNKSLDYLKDLHSCGHPTFIIALNISAKTLLDKKFLDSILKSILNSGLINFIEIEITEGIFIENLDRTSKIIEKMKSQGISIALDDFGTGYSSFSYLHKLSLNKLKIDKSFISNLNNDLKQQVLVDSMISFSKKLGIQVIAEGIETSEQYEWLKKHNCDYGQGYLFSKAVPLDKLKELL